MNLDFSLAGVVVSTLALCAGFLGGYLLAQYSTMLCFQHSPTAQVAAVVTLLQRAQDLQSEVVLHSQELPERLMRAISQLMCASELVRRELPEKVIRLEAPVTAAARTTPTESPRSESASGFHETISDLASRPARGNCQLQAAACSAAEVRHPYSPTQSMAFVNGEGLPEWNDFEEVRCNDISTGGISFFLDRVPDADRLVISLGTEPNLTYMIGRVKSVRLVLGQQKKCYRIGCEFERRVENCEHDWDLALGIGEMAAKLPRVLAAR